MTQRSRSRHSQRRLAALAAAIAIAVVVTGVWVAGDSGSPAPARSGSPPLPSSAPVTGSAAGGQPAVVVQPAGLRLSAGRGKRAAAPAGVVEGEPLSREQIAAVTGRLPAWTGNDALAQPFRWPVQTIKTPPVGKSVTIVFPGADPTNKPVVSPTGPLHVLRIQPQGEVAVAPFASITFDQPMVSVATVGQLTAAQVPATITPAVTGIWNWIGTSTLRFAASSKEVDRLPMATDFTITVPAGTHSATGATLAKQATATFSTPAPSVKQFQPTGPGLVPDPVFVAVFDQRVDPVAVLHGVALAAGSQPWSVRLATPAEVAADPAATRAASAVQPGWSVALRPERALPVATAFTVTFGAGIPSAEGPRATAKAAAFTGRTYSALTMQQTDCGNRSNMCPPAATLQLRFSNSLDPTTFDPRSIDVSPAIPGGVTITAAGPSVFVQGATAPDTTYTVTAAATLQDVFGQHLAAPAVATIKIGPAAPRLDPFSEPITTLDPMATRPSVVVNTFDRTEFRERVFKVAPPDWPTFQHFYVASRQNNQQTDAPAWPILIDRVVAIEGPKNHLVLTTLDLSTVISGTDSSSDVVILIEPTGKEDFGGNKWQNQLTMTWAQSTTLALDALSDNTNLRTWVTDLRDGAPVKGVTVGMVGSDGTLDPKLAATTDADGIASLALTAGGAGALLATNGTQTALLPSGMWQSSWVRSRAADQLLWFVTDDRQTYRPGEAVSVKGWVRRQGADVLAPLTSPSAKSTVAYTVQDADGVAIGHGTTPLSALGGFDLRVAIPAGANLGSASIQLTIDGVSGVDANNFSHPFAIADFRTPDFAVDTHSESGGPAVIGDDLTVATDATYYAGGPLAAAPVDWQVRTAAATYSPPGWNGFTFGIWTPWWQSGASSAGAPSTGAGRAGPAGPARLGAPCCGQPPAVTAKVDKFSGTTDADGHHYLQVQVGDLGKDLAGLPVTVTASATVTDVNRQAIAGTTDLLVHPADYYVGLASDQTFVAQGKDVAVRAIATDIDGAAAPGHVIVMTAAKVTSSWVNGASVDTESNPQTCQVRSGIAPVTCTFGPSVAGQYRITASVVDDKGRSSRSQLTRWVAGPDASLDSSVQLQQLTLVPDKKVYQPGESAQLLVQSPIRFGSGLITLQHNGIITTTRFPVADGSAVVSVPITAVEIPGVTASLEVVGTAARSGAAPRIRPGTAASGAQRPAYATGQIDLAVSTQARTLKVTAVPRQKTVAPGGSTSIDVSVTDQTGKPMAGSEFELVVADEAVLALGGNQLPDPLKAFYPNLGNNLNAVYGRSSVMLADAPRQQSGGQAPMPAGGVAMASAAASASPASPNYSTSTDSTHRQLADATAGAPITQRQNFDALAFFVPSATTDPQGKATIAVPLPDSLTRYRVMVVAVAGDNQFGSAESTITAALPLTVRPSAPRFLNFGDTAALPVLVQNLTDAPLVTDVVIQVANLTVAGGVDGAAGRRVSVPARGRVEVHFPVSADQAGTAKFRIAAVSGMAADAASVTLPVYTPTTTETFATYGVVESGNTLRQTVTAPKGVVSQFGGLQVGASSTALQQLSDAVGYLAGYDYDSSDAFAGQIIAIGSLGDVLKAFSAPGLPAPEALKALVAADVKKLLALQNDDGGFPYWRRGDASDAFNSIQSIQALLVAAHQGFAVPTSSLASAQQFLRTIGSHFPVGASQAAKDTLRAYALNIAMLGGNRDTAGAHTLVAQRGVALPLDAVAWLLPVVTDVTSIAALVRRISNAAVNDAGSVTFTNEMTGGAATTLQSDRRTDGLILDALITAEPTSDLIPKIVSGLLAGQTEGRWANVQENAFILLALRHYYDVFETAGADFTAGIWLGDRFAGQHSFQGHTTERATVSIPTSVLVAAKNDDVTLRNDGTGRLYYRLGLQSAPSDLKVAPLDRGFAVSRTYAAPDNPGDVTRDSSGVWHVKAGATVRVILQMVSRSAQSRVALTDPLPAGLEILNPDLATTPTDLDPKAVAAAAGPASWYGTWYDHQNLRDDRAEAFAGYLPGGVYSYSYLAKATTDGTFVAPPSRAEQIYAPETFGRGSSDRVVIGG